MVASLWSHIHFPEWYENIYFKDLLRRGDTSAKWVDLNEWSDNTLEHIDTTVTVPTNSKLLKRKLFEDICLDWYRGEEEKPPTRRGLLACPCTRRQASVDNRIEDDKSCSDSNSGCDRFFPGAESCIRSVAAR